MQLFSILLNFLYLSGHFALGLISKSHISVVPPILYALSPTPHSHTHIPGCEKTPVDLPPSAKNPFFHGKNLTNVRQVTGNLFSTATPRVRPQFELKLSKNI